MHIKTIELEDIKSHARFKHEFQRGTTAIMGENGAGKSTIIEAIAWTMFDLLDYKKDDFVRRGAGKGVVNITFESGLDEREYRVYRDTKTGYYVYDPHTRTRVADKKDEVQRFLRQHLGVEPGTDLETLFRNAVGVPQGTFTADFLKPPAVRKPIFDKLLKVEEYRQGAEKLLDTVNHIKDRIGEYENKISFAKGKLEDFERTEEEYGKAEKEATELAATQKELEKKVAALEKKVAAFEQQETAVERLKTALDKLRNERERLGLVLGQREKDKERAEEAAGRLERVRAGHEKHLDALGKLKEFERERTEREKLNTALAEVREALVNVESSRQGVTERLGKMAAARKEIEELKPLVETQKRLEERREECSKKIARADGTRKNVARLEKRMDDLRGKLKEVRKKIERAEQNKEKVEQLGEYVQRKDEIDRELTRLRVRLETDRQFQQEVRGGLCPILSEKCLNLREGQTLEGFLSNRFEELEDRIGVLEIEQRDTAKIVEASRNAEKEAFLHETLKREEEEITREGVKLKEEKESEEKALGELPELERELEGIRDELRSLGSPREKIGLLEKELGQEMELREELTRIESNFERLESDRRLKVEQLETYKDLDENWRTYTAAREETAADHREFLANEALAAALPERSKELEETRNELSELKEKLGEAEKTYEEAEKNYDRDRHVAEKADLQTAERELVETGSNLRHTERRRDELKEKLASLKAIRISMADDLEQLERLERVGAATAFIRSTLKEAAPRVARNYVYHVSIEANRMFRDITGNAERTLKWTEDYEIMLEEGGHERPFANLSGGEQMAAALAVRLALLKQLSDVTIAFFDEPTMNMDAERRERLAEQISTITEKQTFDQLFVISHDDTFENYVDHVLLLAED